MSVKKCLSYRRKTCNVTKCVGGEKFGSFLSVIDLTKIERGILYPPTLTQPAQHAVQILAGPRMVGAVPYSLKMIWGTNN